MTKQERELADKVAEKLSGVTMFRAGDPVVIGIDGQLRLARADEKPMGVLREGETSKGYTTLVIESVNTTGHWVHREPSNGVIGILFVDA